jgi:hypothetical protein
MPPPKEVLMGSYFRRVRFAILFLVLFAIGRSFSEQRAFLRGAPLQS